MSQQERRFQMFGGGNNDATYTKIFVGGLAWETQRDTMRRYFEQFGEIQEAVVITDKNTGRSKGYGFVTFKDPEAATRACENPYPVIDGRRANCNLASLGAQKIRPPLPQQGPGRFRPTAGLVAPPAYLGSSSAYYLQPTGQYTYPYSAYGYNTGYSQDTISPLNYYSVYGGQPLISPYYTTAASGPSEVIHNFFPLYAHQYMQNRQAYVIGDQYPQPTQFPYLPRHYYSSSPGVLSASVPSMPRLGSTTTTTAGVADLTVSVAFEATGTASEQHSST